ncbi:MAG: hypothetical protein KDD55_07910 [Bdellovibrionales bacterium]|nr:hypothetical protein [Bdellovibrionales bacterium]
MVRGQLLNLLSSFSKTSSIVDVLVNHGTQGPSLAELHEEIASLFDDELLSLLPESSSMIDLVPVESALSNAAVTLDPTHISGMVEKCNNIRFALYAVALLASENLIDQVVSPDDSTPLTSAVTTLSSGMSYSEIEGYVILLLPKLVDKAQVQLVLDEFLQVYDSTNEKSSWIMDFSSVAQLPSVSFFGGLVHYLDCLQGEERDLHLCWVRPKCFRSEEERTRLEKRFHLEEIAGYLFSSQLPQVSKEER